MKKTGTSRRLLVLATTLALALPVPGWSEESGPDPDPEPPAATLHEPLLPGVRGGPMTSSVEPLDGDFPYLEVEYLASGTATDRAELGGFILPNTPNLDTADYTTRVMVKMPADPAHFNGTVFVEWNNVTFQTDIEALWATSNDMLMRHGYGYVGVSAQKPSVDNSPMSLKAWDPVRYAEVTHPGDQFAYDIYAQVSRAVVKCDPDTGAICPFEGYDLEAVIATGSSQSGTAMYQFINGYHELVPDLFDGYLGQVSSVTEIRDDLAPVLWINSESEADRPSRHQSGPLYRYWEVAGASHGDIRQASYTLAQIARDGAGVPTSQSYSRFDQYGERQAGGNCPQNFMPSRWAVNAAIVAIDRWARNHAHAPTEQPPYGRDAEGAVVRDEHENIVGGLKLPPASVPIAGYVGDQCWLVGRMTQFDRDTLAELYDSHDDYLRQLRTATNKAVADRILLREDGDHLLELARATTIFEAPVS